MELRSYLMTSGRPQVQELLNSADLDSVVEKVSASRAFRLQARSWLSSMAGAAGPAAGGTEPGAFVVDGHRLVVLEPAHLRAGHALDAVLLVNGDFSCGAGCVFLQPMHVAGNCEIGKSSRVNGVTAEGSLVLGASVDVRSWVDSDRAMDIRTGCRIGGSAVSGTRIQLGTRCSAGRLSAPEVRLQTDNAIRGESPLEPDRVVELPPPGNEGRLPRQAIPGLDPSRLEAAGADTWFYDGDLYLPESVLLSSHLVTRGYFACQGGSLLEGDVLAGTALYVGEGSLIRGHLTGGEDLVLEAQSVFQGNVRSKGRIRLCSGVRGFRAGGPVEVTAGRNLVVEDGVVIRGRMESDERILSVARERTVHIERLRAAGW
jgi:predicted acyltransferase (DUF342 family)